MMAELKVQREGEPMALRCNPLDMQVCVPKVWTEQQALEFAEKNNPCGTANGWSLRRKGSEYLGGDDERQQCSEHESHVHIMLDA